MLPVNSNVHGFGTLVLLGEEVDDFFDIIVHYLFIPEWEEEVDQGTLEQIIEEHLNTRNVTHLVGGRLIIKEELYEKVKNPQGLVRTRIKQFSKWYQEVQVEGGSRRIRLG
jgi:hypothetical protein